MTTKTILVTGFGAGVTELAVQSWLASFGPVAWFPIVRDDNANLPIFCKGSMP
jgi:type IV secretory pathway TrbD component